MKKEGLIALIIILAVVVIFAGVKISSFVIAEDGTCEDSDGGKDYFTKGNVIYYDGEEETVSEDYCLNKDEFYEDSKALREYVCQIDKISGRTHFCEIGCEDGACISGEETVEDIEEIVEELDEEVEEPVEKSGWQKFYEWFKNLF